MTVPIEVDVTYVNHAWYSSIQRRKVPQKPQYVIGLFQREGNVIIRVMPDNKPETIEEYILKHIVVGCVLYAHKNILPTTIKEKYVVHEIPEGKHSEGDVHISNLNNIWKDLKRVIKGTHIQVSSKHLPLYCGEVEFRINTRHMTPSERFHFALSRVNIENGNKRCTYDELTK